MSATALSYACTGLATVTSSPDAAAVGSSVVVNGKGFSPHDPTDARTEPVRIRFDSQSGPVIASASPSSAADGGKFSVTIAVPELAVGDHVLIATQNGADGRPAYGTPARQAFRVVAPPSSAPALAGGSPAALEAPAVFGLPAVGPVTGARPASATRLSRAIAACRRKYRPSSARTARGRQRMTRRRAACIRTARARYS